MLYRRLALGIFSACELYNLYVGKGLSWIYYSDLSAMLVILYIADQEFKLIPKKWTPRLTHTMLNSTVTATVGFYMVYGIYLPTYIDMWNHGGTLAYLALDNMLSGRNYSLSGWPTPILFAASYVAFAFAFSALGGRRPDNGEPWLYPIFNYKQSKAWAGAWAIFFGLVGPAIAHGCTYLVVRLLNHIHRQLKNSKTVKGIKRGGRDSK